MLEKGKWKKRALSLLLVMMLAMTTVVPVSIVNAEDTTSENAMTQPTVEEVQTPDADTNDDASQPDGALNPDEAENQQDDAALTEDDANGDENSENADAENENPDVSVMSLGDTAPEVGTQGETGKGITVTLTVQGYGYLALSPIQVTLPDTYKTFAEYGLTDVTDPGYYTPLHAMAQYCLDVGKDPATKISASGSGFSNFLGVDDESNNNTFIMLCVNNLVPDSSTVSDYALQNSDVIQLFDWYYTYNSTYAYFAQSTYEGTTGNAFLVNLKATDMTSMWAGSSPENIEIFAMDSSGNELDNSLYSSTKTNAFGVGTVTIQQEGTYTLAARRINGDVNELNYPTCSVTISKAPELSDGAIVSQVKETLDIGNTSAVTERLALPEIGSYGATITWTSSDETVVKADGTVAREVQADKTVTLTAAISKGKAVTTKTFTVTVKGYYDLLDLSVNAGGLDFAPMVNTYRVYVSKDIAELEVTATVNGLTDKTGGVSYFKINGKSKFMGSGDTATETEKVSLIEDETTIPIEITRNISGKGMTTATTTLLIKKATNPGIELPDIPTSWPQHLGGDNNNAVTTIETAKENTELVWENFAEGEGSWGSWYAGTPILVNGKIYAARNNQIQIINASTGTIEQSTPLKSALGFYSYITYGGGKIFVPLGNGSIQCFDATTLKSLFVTQIPGIGMNASSSIYYKAGMLYTGVTDWTQGKFLAYDTTDLDVDNEYEVVAPEWTYGTNSYYGMGAVQSNGYLVFAGDVDSTGKATVVVADPKTGEEKDTISVDGNVRCSIVEAEGSIWLTTQAGTIYKMAVGTDGTIVMQASAALPGTSNASPVITNGKVYVTGGAWGAGFVSVFDTSLNKLCEGKTAGQANTPTVSMSGDTAYMYFTQNAEPGALFVAKVTKDNKITVQTLYTPTHSQYSMSNVIIGEDGTIYYGNDAGYIYALKAASVPTPAPTPEPTPTPTPSPAPLLSGNNRGTGGTTLLTANVKQVAEEQTTESIAEAIQTESTDGKTSLTIKNAPDTIESEVFEELQKHKDFRLILDFGTYTMSIKGSDVTNPKASLKARLIEEKSTLNKKQEEVLGNFQQLKFEQDEELPGAVTFVYQLPKKLEKMEAGILYEQANLTSGQDVTVSSPYAMFTLKKCGTYILADAAEDAVDVEDDLVATNQKGITDAPVADTKQPSYVLWIVIGIVAVLAAGGIGVGVVMRRRKENTWEE